MRLGKGLFRIPNAEEHIAARMSAIHLPSGISGKAMSDISRRMTSSIGDDWRLRLSRGNVVRLLFCFNPKSNEA